MARKKTSKPLSVAVTGAAGLLASRLIEKLCEDERIGSVVGFDVRPPQFTHSKFVFDELDVRDAALESRLKGVDTVVHLAFIMDPIRDENRMRDVNVNGSQNVFKCAAKAGVDHVVYTSSAVVYGAHPDNKIPLDEDAPLRANLDFSYAAHKLEVEYVIREVLDDYPKLALTVFRPAIVFGPHVDNAWSHSLELPVIFWVQGHSPPLQFVHEEDVADALAFAIFEKITGAYNLAAPGWLEVEEILEIADRRKFDLPEPVAFGMVERLWSLGLAEAPASEAQGSDQGSRRSGWSARRRSSRDHPAEAVGPGIRAGKPSPAANESNEGCGGLCYPRTRPGATRGRQAPGGPTDKRQFGVETRGLSHHHVLGSGSGIGTLWLQQKRERSHLESSEKFLSSLQKISPDVKPIQRRPGRRPVAQGTRRTGSSRTPGRRPTRSEVARREAARRRVEARRRSQTVATRSRAAS